MPEISLDLTIPANYNKATHAPVEQKANVGPCKIKSVVMQFPAGCQYLAKVALYASLHGQAKQIILPSIVTGDALDYVALDDFVHEFPINMQLPDPATIYADGWNEDAANAHEIKILVHLETR